MDRVELHKPLFIDREGGKVAPERLKDLPDLFLGALAVADQAVGDQLFDVGPAQGQPNRVAVFDFVEGILADFPRLLDPFLQRAHDPEGKRGGLLSQVLEKPDILPVGMGVGLGAQKLGEFVHQKDQAGETQPDHGFTDFFEGFLPRFLSFEGTAQAEGELPEDLLQEDVLEKLRPPVLYEGDFHDEKFLRLDGPAEILQGRLLLDKGGPGLGLAEEQAEHAQEMGFPRPEIPLQKGPPPFRPGQGFQDHPQAFRYLGGDHKGVEDHPPEVRPLQVLQLNDRLDLRNLDQVSDPSHFPASLGTKC